MCGIVGILNLGATAPVEETVLRRMTSSIAHRGPDGEGIWVAPDGQIGLGHRRLSIQDLSDAGRQPMVDARGEIWVTFNGEIYNFPTLRRMLEQKGYQFRSHSDTEVILYLYREEGERFYELLDGDFAIGLWDARSKKLILARDRAGVKPLYYTLHDGRLLFASEIKALLQYPGMQPALDPQALYHYLTYLVVPAPATLLQGILKMPAATAMVVDARQPGPLKPKKYWEPLPRSMPNTHFDELDEELASLFRASVEKRKLSDVPVGVLFSGGVDSTLNLCAFAQQSTQPVNTFTVGMRDAGDFHDDSAIARRMAAQLGTRHHEIIISEQDVLNTAQQLAYLQDEPVSDPVAVPLYFVTKLAREQGVTVLQAGEGADELFCGYDNYRRFLRHHETHWQRLQSVPRAFSRAGAALLPYTGHPLAGKVADILQRHTRGQEFFMSSAVAFYDVEKRSILSRDFREAARHYDAFDAVAPLYARLHEAAPHASMLQAITFIELQLRLPELLLMRADKMAMANAIEIRVPFLDRDLMDFALRVPDAYKLRDGISKEPIKRLASQYVAREEIYRPKTGFGLPIRHWFHGKLGADMRHMLGDHADFANQYFDTQALLKRPPRTTNEAFKLWTVYNLLSWFNGIRQDA